jgi:L-2-hydroxyglutarate oxidase
MYDFCVVGGGIVGLATAFHLLEAFPGRRLVLVEKEAQWASHQTGHNSGVIHSGLYYRPGSLKARLAREGNRGMVEFCRREGIRVEICGKLVVATEERELAPLEKLYRRGLENGLAVRRVGADEAREIEPHANVVGAIHLPTTGITDYRQVCDRLAAAVGQGGGELRPSTEVRSIGRTDGGVVVTTARGEIAARFLIACAGLQSDRVARSEGLDPEARIVPFRGEYYELRPEKRHLVRGLIYPVPNPDFPFLGVHLTKMIDGSVHAGPNAVLAFAREGYRKGSVSPRDLGAALLYPGFWRMASKNLSEGWKEMRRSWSRRLFVESLQRLVPDITLQDVVPAEAGIRAQALKSNGELVDDFLFVHGPRSLHVCNAPSPAATASLEIGRLIVEEVRGRF